MGKLVGIDPGSYIPPSLIRGALRGGVFDKKGAFSGTGFPPLELAVDSVVLFSWKELLTISLLGTFPGKPWEKVGNVVGVKLVGVTAGLYLRYATGA